VLLEHTSFITQYSNKPQIGATAGYVLMDWACVWLGLLVENLDTIILFISYHPLHHKVAIVWPRSAVLFLPLSLHHLKYQQITYDIRHFDWLPERMIMLHRV